MIVGINITEEDIANGMPGYQTCAMSVAVRRYLPSLDGIGGQYFWFRRPEGQNAELHFWRADLTPRQQDFTAQFDRGGEVFPFFFELDVPEWLEVAE